MIENQIGPPKRDIPRPISGVFSTSVDVGDFNGDGLTDIVSPVAEGIVLLLQTEEGALEATDPLLSDPPSILVRVGDFNRDGRDDVASLPRCFLTDDVYIYIQGDEGLSSPVTYTMSHTGHSDSDLKAGDLNGDDWSSFQN